MAAVTPLVSAAPRPGPTPSLTYTWPLQSEACAQHSVGAGQTWLFSSFTLGLILPPPCVFSLSRSAASVGSGFSALVLPLLTSLGICFLSLCVSLLLSVLLSLASHRSS